MTCSSGKGVSEMSTKALVWMILSGIVVAILFGLFLGPIGVFLVCVAFGFIWMFVYQTRKQKNNQK